MKEKKAVKLILTARKKARIIGGMLLAFIILAGILGWIFWKWYALVIVVVVGLDLLEMVRTGHCCCCRALIYIRIFFVAGKADCEANRFNF